MAKLLFIQASPRGAGSQSIEIARVYLSALRVENPDLEVDELDLWREDLPVFDGDKVAAKINVMLGKEHNGIQKTAWDQIVDIANRFVLADRYLFAVPMWNYGIPYPLKHYIDVINQPGILFGLKPESGYFGLLDNKHATLILTSGAFSQAAPSSAYGVDFHSTYLRNWLETAGVSAIDEVRFQPTLLTSDPVVDFERAKQDAIRLAGAHGRVQMIKSGAA